MIELLMSDEPGQKMYAASQLEQMGSKKAVPYLLAEVRDKYGPVICEPSGDMDVVGAQQCFVVRNGKKVPYVDYHGPLFQALSRLAVPYFEPDKDWFHAIEEWIADNP